MDLLKGVRKPLAPSDFARARVRLLQMHFDAGVGHIGGNLSALDAMLIVFNEYLRPSDTFILSKGHAAGALYISLWSVGRLRDDELKTFNKDDTLLAVHPPVNGFAEIPFATGSLGHGVSLAAGTALGYELRGEDRHVYCLTSDGEWQEGSTWEGLIFAAHRELTNLTILVDHNNLQGFGSTADVASMSPLWERLQGFKVDVEVIPGHDFDAIRSALDAPAERLRVIILKTTKGRGVGFMPDRMEWHYLPLNEEQLRVAIEEVRSR
jgi:transketolase